MIRVAHGAAAYAASALLVALAGCTEHDHGAAGAVAAAPQAVPVPASPESLAPRLAEGPDGRLVLSWLEPEGAEHVLQLAEWQGGQFGSARSVARGSGWAVSQADLPAVVPITGDVWIAQWHTTSPEGFLAYDIAMAVSTDGGRTFGPPRLLNDDGTATEHGFTSWFEWDGAIGVVWLDGRNLALETGDGAAPPGTSLRFARIGADGQTLEEAVVDELACDCCQTDVALGAAGPVVTYRDRTPDERRDVVARTFANGAWSEPVELGPDGWVIEGCPVNGPAADADGREVVIAWFTAPGNRPRVRFARSRDGGASFMPAVDVDAEAAYGHVGVALLDDGRAVVSWWRRGAPGHIDLAAQVVGADGALGERITLASAGASRPTDVPQLMAAGRRVLAAWTDPAEGGVRAAYLDLR